MLMYSLGNPTNGSEFLYISILSMIMFFFSYHLGNPSNGSDFKYYISMFSISTRKPLERVRVIMYPTIIYISSFLPWTTIILQVYSHISHSSHITLTNLPGICAEIRGGEGNSMSHIVYIFFVTSCLEIGGMWERNFSRIYILGVVPI